MKIYGNTKQSHGRKAPLGKQRNTESMLKPAFVMFKVKSDVLGLLSVHKEVPRT